MILIENKELLIPNNERYIGTTQDALSENRYFRVRRVTQSGVDMANLTFRLDLKYPETRKIYSFETSSSRVGRIVRVNARAWTKQYQDAGTYLFTYDGSAWTYSGQTVDLAKIGVSIYFTPASGDTVTVAVTFTDAAGDTVILDKEVTDDHINLTWQISDTQLSAPGSVLISLRASDEVGTVRWASYYATLYVEQNGYMPSDYSGTLSEMEQLENDLAQDIAVIEEMAQKSVVYGDEAEAWAVGTRSGVEVEEGDETYHNNSKYYAEQAAGSAANASTSETNAKTSETNAAGSEATASAAATTATEAAASALTSETNAATSESNARTSETNAKTSETNASGSEASASASASAAGTSETNAAGSASEAVAAAELAKKYRDEAAEKIDDASVSTATAYSSSKVEERDNVIAMMLADNSFRSALAIDATGDYLVSDDNIAMLADWKFALV